MPRLSFYVEKERLTEYNSLLEKSLNFLLMFSFPMVAGLMVLSKPIVMIFGGSSFVESIFVMQVMSPLLLIVSLNSFTGMQIFVPLKKEFFVLVSTIIAAFFNFIMNFILIPIIGVIGAGIASVVAECCVMSINLIFARKYFNFLKIVKPISQYLFGTMFMGVSVYFLNKIFTNMILSVFLCTIIGAGIYALVLFVLKNNFFLDMLNMIKFKIWRKK